MLMFSRRVRAVLMAACAVVLCCGFVSAHAEVRRVTMEDGFSHSTHPAEWRLSSVTDAANSDWKQTTAIKLTFAVQQRNVKKLTALLENELANPDHERYRAWMSHEEVNAFIAPHAKSILTVRAFIESFGLTDIEQSPSGDFLLVTTTVARAEDMLACEYARFDQVGSSVDASIVRTLGQYSLPAAVAGVVDFVQPTHHFPPRAATLKIEHVAYRTHSNTNGGYNGVTPAVLREMYNIGDTEGANSTANRQVCV
jgi:subtilase family serine protease